MISRNHATIERLPDGGFILYDHSMNGTYVNYVRVSGGVTLKNGDIVCFGHLNGANLKPGDGVVPFFSDLKYQAFVGPTKQVAAAISKAPDSHSDRLAGGKRPNKSPTGSSHDVKKGVSKATPSRHMKSEDESLKSEQEEEESDEDLMDRLAKRKSVPPPAPASSSKKAPVSKSNGAKRHAASPPPSKKSKTHHSSSKKPRGKASSDEDSIDDDMGSPVNEEVHHVAGEDDQEECSARVCKKPTGPSIDWIQCDKCTKWYHQICLNLTAAEANVEKYFCPSCVKKR
ncbi:unnamed protein product [Hymenolepis diminuta]|uniref:FHA domain-containing protein n=1 Tax=Hymenolepis diminuta TaxID=6216 RepID=A0A564YRF5_HYMDI|nr:unnamed protein product [Hymenolepis diminuta]